MAIVDLNVNTNVYGKSLLTRKLVSIVPRQLLIGDGVEVAIEKELLRSA